MVTGAPRPVDCVDGLYANPLNCSQYYLCRDNLYSLRDCPVELDFASGVATCIDRDRSNCSRGEYRRPASRSRLG